MKIETAGTKVDQIPVFISYRIIELFSAGLYSSPNKAFEELVSNSYDAGATKVSVRVDIKDSTKFKESILWVCDNGLGMNIKGLKDFWQIGVSTKVRGKDEKRAKFNRLAIGKFGIGKLATYILTRHLTLISKTSQGYYAVTMDYNDISKDFKPGQEKQLLLDERKLTLEEVKTVLNPLVKVGEDNQMNFELWGPNAEKTWTIAIMSGLRDKALQIQEGRLKYILKTALPLNPNFNLHFNGEELHSLKAETPPKKVWRFGENDNVVKKNPKIYKATKYQNEPAINIPDLDNVVGSIEYYEESFLKNNKSERWARSHGIFLMVRGRLINIDDSLLGMPALTHGVFNRVRIMVYADELDTFITSGRESIIESAGLESLRVYIGKKFTEVKDFHFNNVRESDKKNYGLSKIAKSPSSLTRLPIVNGIRKFAQGQITEFYSATVPEGLSKTKMNHLVDALQEDLMSEEGILKDIVVESMDVDDPIAVLDVEHQRLKINLMHPFFSNFIDSVKSQALFQIIGWSEVLHEFHLHESGFNEQEVLNIMEKRDQTLRELSANEKPSGTYVAMLLKNSINDPSGLEDNVVSAFNLLGLETRKISGKNQPDGIALAKIAHKGSKDRYSLTFDAKSTGKNAIAAATAHITGVKRHQVKHEANYSCVVAVGFEGADDLGSAINVEATTHKVTLLTVSDLASLVILAGIKSLTPLRLRDLFESCHSTVDTEAWIENFKNEEIERGPIKELLETVHKLYDDFEAPTLSVVRTSHPTLHNKSLVQLRELVKSLSILLPGEVSISNDDIISVMGPPDKILERLRLLVSEMPRDFKDEYVKAFGTKPQKKQGSKKK